MKGDPQRNLIYHGTVFLHQKASAPVNLHTGISYCRWMEKEKQNLTALVRAKYCLKSMYGFEIIAVVINARNQAVACTGGASADANESCEAMHT